MIMSFNFVGVINWRFDSTISQTFTHWSLHQENVCETEMDQSLPLAWN